MFQLQGISFLTHELKIFERFLERKPRINVEDKLNEAQSDFRSRRGVTDLIFSMKMMIGLRRETGMKKKSICGFYIPGKVI